MGNTNYEEFGPTVAQGRLRVSSRGTAQLSAEEIAIDNELRKPSKRLKTLDNFCQGRVNVKGGGAENRKPCPNKKGFGTNHPGWGYCKFHGGTTPAGQKAAARELGRSLIQQQRDRFGGDRSLPINNVTAEEALLEEVRRSVAMVRWLEDRIGSWSIDPLEEVLDRQNVAIESGRGGGSGGGGGTDALAGLPPLVDETSRGGATFTDHSEWLKLYREERTHMAKVSKMAIDAGIAERMVSIAEDQGRILATAVRAILDSLQLTPAQANKVPTIVPAILRAAAAGTPINITSLEA